MSLSGKLAAAALASTMVVAGAGCSQRAEEQSTGKTDVSNSDVSPLSSKSFEKVRTSEFTVYEVPVSENEKCIVVQSFYGGSVAIDCK